MTQDNDGTAREFYDAWNARDFDRVAGLVAQDGEIVLVGSEARFSGPEGARQWSLSWAGGFPDGEVMIDRVLSAGDQVVVQFTGRGTHTGDFVTPGGTLPPTGRRATLKFCDVLDVSGGKITSMHSYFDTASLLTQLGLMSAPAAAHK
jgi:ketosteroid isomerase-like protein